MDLRIPAILVIPLTLSYSLLDDDSDTEIGEGSTPDENDGVEDTDTEDGDVDVEPQQTSDASEEVGDEKEADDPDDDSRDVFFIGLGDAVIPGVLVASAAFFSPAPRLAVPVIELNLPALLALVGTLGGLIVLMRMVMKGRAHAGLPLLNGGAIGGYVLGSLLAGIPILDALGLAGFI